MIIDNKGRLFGKINLLDVFFVLILIGVLFVAYILFAGGGQADNKLHVTYTVEVQNQDAAYFEHVIAGEQVTDGVTKASMGKITDFSKEPAKVISQKNDTLVLSNPQGRFDGLIQIEAEADVAYPDILLDGQTIKIGKEVALRSESVAMHGFIVAIDYDAEQLEEVK